MKFITKSPEVQWCLLMQILLTIDLRAVMRHTDSHCTMTKKTLITVLKRGKKFLKALIYLSICFTVFSLHFIICTYISFFYPFISYYLCVFSYSASLSAVWFRWGRKHNISSPSITVGVDVSESWARHICMFQADKTTAYQPYLLMMRT